MYSPRLYHERVYKCIWYKHIYYFIFRISVITTFESIEDSHVYFVITYDFRREEFQQDVMLRIYSHVMIIVFA